MIALQTVAFALYRADLGTERTLAARVRVAGADIQLLDAADPSVAPLLTAIRSEPFLDFYKDSVRPGPDGKPIRAMTLAEVAPGDPDYAFALSQEFCRRGHFEAVFD
jgi:hypothetical protein